MTSKLKLTFAWNVWNTYEDVLLGTEILVEQNNAKNLFSDIFSVSFGGFETPPNEREASLSHHYFVDFPKVPLSLFGPPKFKGIFRVFAGLKKAYEIGRDRGDDYVLVTNADAWYLDIKILNDLLNHLETRRACISCRIGNLTSLNSNASSILPMTDDHFVIINVKECEKSSVFEYDDNVQFYHSIFGHIGSMHNLFYQFLMSRVPVGKLFIYSSLETATGQYGDKIGWNLLPWQFDQKFMLIHANCAQKNELHFLRAELMRSLGFDKNKFMNEYCNRYLKINSPFKIAYKQNFPVRKRTFKRKLHDNTFFWLRKASSYLQFFFKRQKGQKISQEHLKNFFVMPPDFLN